jgi:hypothetical protein
MSEEKTRGTTSKQSREDRKAETERAFAESRSRSKRTGSRKRCAYVGCGSSMSSDRPGSLADIALSRLMQPEEADAARKIDLG